MATPRAGWPRRPPPANLDAPGGVAVDSSGNLYIADTTDQMVAMVASSACSLSCPLGLSSTTTGDIYAVAGTGTASYTGDGGGAATTALERSGRCGGGLVGRCVHRRHHQRPGADGAGVVGHVLRSGHDSGRHLHGGGTGTACSTHTPAGCGYTSGGVPQLATTALLDLPGGVAADSSGNLYIADTSDNMVAMVATTSCSSACPFGLTSTTAGDIYTIAGTGTACASTTAACGDTGAPGSATLNAPSGIAVMASGSNMYIADKTDRRIRELISTPIVAPVELLDRLQRNALMGRT